MPTAMRVLDSGFGRTCCVLLTFLIVCLTWIPFRATSFELMGTYLQRMFLASAGRPAPALPEAVVLYSYLLVAACHWLGCQTWFNGWLKRLPSEAVGFGYCSILALALLLAPRAGQAFIYFQF